MFGGKRYTSELGTWKTKAKATAAAKEQRASGKSVRVVRVVMPKGHAYTLYYR